MNPRPSSPLQRTSDGSLRGWITIPHEIPAEVIPNLDELRIEADAPLENVFAEKQHRLLTEPLYSNWRGPREGCTFQVFANVGLFFGDKVNPLTPNVMLASDIPTGGDLELRENRSYFMWERRGIPPAVAIELVSDRRSRDEDFKLGQYSRIGVPFYAIFDPADRLRQGMVRSFINSAGAYQPLAKAWFPLVGLGLVVWEGVFEGHSARWLRWCDEQWRVIPTGHERAEQLEAKLRALGIDPHQP